MRRARPAGVPDGRSAGTRPRHRRAHPPGRRAAAALGAAVLAGCTQGGLQPRGEEAERIFTLTWTLTLAGTVVAVIVLALLVWGAVRKHRGDPKDAREEDVEDTRFEKRMVIGGGIVLPAIILLGFFVFNLGAIRAQPQGGEFTLDVVGHQYWWEVFYRDVPGVEPFETANQIHVPVGTEVKTVLRSADVIHSFWVPQLFGKMDNMPGRENEFSFIAEEPGVYPGYCAEFCGLQHAWMKFEIVAMEPDDFEQWVADQATDAPPAQTALEQRGQEVFVQNACVGCHAIRGVADQGELGPDLTHLASRRDIGAGILPLTEDNLAAWTVNPQAIKPGVNMPPQELDDDDLDALVAYLMSLE